MVSKLFLEPLSEEVLPQLLQQLQLHQHAQSTNAVDHHVVDLDQIRELKKLNMLPRKPSIEQFKN